MDYFNWLPDELRQKALSQVKGWQAVSFPAPYFMKVPKSRLVYLLNKYHVKHRGNELLDCLNNQYLDLKSGRGIKPITLIGRDTESLKVF